MNQPAVPTQTRDGKKEREPVTRRYLDHIASITQYIQQRAFGAYEQYPQNIPNQRRYLLPTWCYASPGTSVEPKFNWRSKDDPQISMRAMDWIPNSNFIVTGNDKGKITIWDGLGFNFKATQKIDNDEERQVNDIKWSHNGDFMLAMDSNRMLSVYQTNFNLLEKKQIHDKDVKQITFSPNDRKFATCSDDTTIKIWDFSTLTEDLSLRGHSAEIATVDWHPTEAFIASGGKDPSIRFWDPRTGTNVATVSCHSGLIRRVTWNPDGNLVLSGGKDQTVFLTDARMMESIKKFTGHEKDVYSIAWNPTHRDMFVSGGYTGDIIYWCIGCDEPIYKISKAQTKYIAQLRFHPMGHILASCGNDGFVFFRNRLWCSDDESKSINITKANNAVSNIIVKTEESIGDIPGLASQSELMI